MRNRKKRWTLSVSLDCSSIYARIITFFFRLNCSRRLRIANQRIWDYVFARISRPSMRLSIRSSSSSGRGISVAMKGSILGLRSSLAQSISSSKLLSMGTNPIEVKCKCLIFYRGTFPPRP